MNNTNNQYLLCSKSASHIGVRVSICVCVDMQYKSDEMCDTIFRDQKYSKNTKCSNSDTSQNKQSSETLQFSNMILNSVNTSVLNELLILLGFVLFMQATLLCFSQKADCTSFI